MTTYGIADLTIASELPLPELAGASGAPAWTFGLAHRRFAVPATWFQRWRSTDGQRGASFARVPDGYLLRFHGSGDYRVDTVARTIECRPRRGATEATIRHLLLDQVIPLVLSRSPRLVLHAAAIATPRGAVALVGRGGSGKSTLAAALAARGLPLMSDDCVVIQPQQGGLIARPFYSGVRLFPDSLTALRRRGRSTPVAHYTRKRRVAGDALPFHATPLPLARVFVLKAPRRTRRPPPIEARRLASRDAMLEILACTFHLDTADPVAARTSFELNSRLAATLPVDLLSYPWRYSALPDITRAIARMIGARDGG